MPELVLLTAPSVEIKRLNASIARGDTDAAKAFFVALWAPYKQQLADGDMACFLCNATLTAALPDSNEWAELPFTQLLPDYAAHQSLLAPLCCDCMNIPPMLRFHKCLTLCRRMYSARKKKQVHFTFGKSR